MATTYATEYGAVNQTPPNKISSAAYGTGLIRRRATITYASQAAADVIKLCKLPAGETFAFGVLTADTSSGSTTIAIGISGTAAKYRAAATFTATDTPTLFGKAAAVGAQTELTADEEIIATLAAATAPSSGTLVIDIYSTAV